MSRHWMPMYWSDFKADTEHLGALETDAYMMLIGHYWNTGGLPNDDTKLARIARMTPEEWEISKSTIAEFFQDGWRHKRIDIELSAPKINQLPPPPVSEVIDYQGKIAELVAKMSLHEQEQALKMIEILALKLD